MPPPGDVENTEIRNMADEPGAYPSLEILTGPKGGGRYRLKTGKNVLGRSRECDIVLDDSSVSRRHAVIDVAENGATVADLGSRNGTKVGGQKINQAVSLAHKTRVKIGVYILRFLTGPVSAEEEEVSVVSAEGGETDAQGPSEPVPADGTTGQIPLEKGEGKGEGEGEGGAEAGDIPMAGQESRLPAEVPPAGSLQVAAPAKVTRPGGRKKLFYLAGGIALIVILALSAPLVLKYFKKGKKPDAGAGGKKVVQKVEKDGKVGGVLPAETQPISGRTPTSQPVFLDFSSTPIPAQVFFGEQPVGVSPTRISTKLNPGKWYEARAVFQLPEVGEVVEEKAQFSPPTGATLMPVTFPGKIGIFKVAAIPKNSQLYLEGYFQKDPYRAKPIKFAEIVFGKPIYVPFGRYILELRRSRQLGGSQTYIDEVVYRREFFINETQTTFTVDVNEDGLKVFPVQITSLPPNAKVFIDEKEVGSTPFNGAFPVGEHLLTLKREGFFDFVQVVKMEINMPYVAEIQLKTSAAGELINKADAFMKEQRHVEALPILVDAFGKNPSPLETAQISHLVGVCYLKQKQYKEAQDYFLKAMQHDGYKYPARLGIATVTFEQGDTMRALQLLVEVLVASEDQKVRNEAGQLFQRISPLKSVMYITSEPSGARVFVNGTEMEQKTPLILHDLGVGSYRITFRKDGYQDSEIKLNLGVSEFRPVVSKLIAQ